MAKRHRIIDPDHPPEERLGLFGEDGRIGAYPPIYRDEWGVRKVLEGSRDGIGLDLEYTNNRPTVLGVANDEECVGVKWNPSLARLVVDHTHSTKQPLVAYSCIGADLPVMEEALGIRLPLEMWEDPMRSHYLTHMCLAKAPGKSEDEDDTGALGMMNLWTAASLATDLPQWKECRGYMCTSTNPHPCSTHDVFGYCAIDAWAGLIVHRVCQKGLEEQGTPYKLYRELMELGEMCRDMENQGVLVDMEHIRKLEESADARKDLLFPIVEIEGGGEGYALFNPKSPKQVMEWFAKRKIPLKGTDKKIIRGELRKAARKAGYGNGEDLEKVEEALPEVLDALYRLDQYKAAGKGLKAWFDSRWVGKDGLVHPRFIDTGTSTGRLASSKPNCFDGQTEILTTTGWKFFRDLAADDLVAQWHEDGTITFTKPTAIQRYLYSGAMVHISNKHVDLRVTDDHRCLLQNRRTKKLCVCRADEYLKDARQLGAGHYSGPGLPLSPEQIQFLVAVQADGSYSKSGLDFSFVKARKIERLKTILAALSIQSNWRPRKTGGWRTWISCPLWVYEYLGPHKVFGPWILELSREQVAVFTNELFYWDGLYTRKTNYASRDRASRDWASIALCLSGKRVRERTYINEWGSISYQVDISKNGRGYSSTAGIKKLMKEVAYEPVYCVSVPSSFVLVRRNGCVMVTGQCQNIPVRGFGAEVRRAIIARPGFKLISADKRQLELRMCLWLAGVDPKTIEGDAFNWLVEKSGTAFVEAATRYHMTERDIAKSVSHSSDYLEGFAILRPRDFDARRLDEIDRGALKVYWKKYMPELKRDWEYGGGVVAFTGANLADRLFGDKSVESRKKALEIQEGIYFKNFSMLREWQQTVLEEVERTGGVRLETGRFVRLPDITSESPKENAKIACAIKGQGNSAEHIISIMLSYHRMGVVPILQVHDELVFEMPVDWGEREMREFLEPMMVEDWRLKGFICPIKAKVGLNWLDMVPVNLEKS